MADLRDVTTAIVSALTEISITGEIDVTMGQARSVQYIGSPTGDDYQVIVFVLPLQAADRPAEHG